MNRRDFKLLIIDDDIERNRTLKKLLDPDFLVYQAFSGKEGLDMARQELFQLVLLDVMLPDINGFDVLKGLKNDPYNHDNFVVMISSILTSPEKQCDGLESGADGYLVFPMANRELLARIWAFCRHKKTIDQLRASENQFKSILENTPDGVLMLDAEGKIEYANKSVRNLFSLDPDQLVSLDFGTPLVTGEKTIIDIHSKDGPRTAEMRVLEAFIGGRKKQIASFSDITSHRLTEERMNIQVNELLTRASHNDKLLSLIAHDLKGPFNVLLNMSEILVESIDKLQIKDIVRYTTSIHQSSQQIFSLLLNLLDWSRINIGHVRHFPQWINIKSIAERVKLIYGDMAYEKQISLIVDIPDDLLIYVDENIINAILRNLISNSLKFTPPGGFIKLETLSSGSSVRMIVTDNGVGMTPDTLNRIFNQDQIGEKNHPQSGTGLGLILCRQLIGISGGNIEISSIYGQGTRVICTFSNIVPEKTVSSV